MANEESAGRKDTLAIMLGSGTLWGEGYSAELLITLLGIHLLLEVLIDFAGEKRILSTTTFPWLLAEDNPVISC